MGSSTWGPAILLLVVLYLPEKKLVFLVINDVVVSSMGRTIYNCFVILEDILAEGNIPRE